MTTKTKTTWRTVRLGDVATLQRGYDLPVDEMKKGDHPVVFSNGKIEYHNASKVKGPGVITGRSGTLGNIFYIAEDYWPHNTTLYVKDFHGNDPHFIYYLFKRLNFAHFNAGSGVPTLNRNHVHDIPVQITEKIDEQKRIAGVLAAFDEKIENNNRIIKTLEEMAQAIFKEWFVQNPVDETQTVKLKELVQIISGYPFSSSLYVTDKQAFGVVTIKNVQDGSFVTDCDSRIREADVPHNMNEECRLGEGDILLSLTGNVGRACFVYGGQYLLNQRVAKIKPNKVEDKAFAYFLFRQSAMQNKLINMAKGSAQPNLSPVETGAIELEVPSRQTLDRFSNLATPMFQQIVEQSLENQKLAAMRDLLLPRLMIGEIRV